MSQRMPQGGNPVKANPLSLQEHLLCRRLLSTLQAAHGYQLYSTNTTMGPQLTARQRMAAADPQLDGGHPWNLATGK